MAREVVCECHWCFKPFPHSGPILCAVSDPAFPVVAPIQVEGDLLLGDMGQGLPARLGAFDGAISISAVQWLCNADKASHDPRRRLKRFFETLYGALARGARAVLQVRGGGGRERECDAGLWNAGTLCNTLVSDSCVGASCSASCDNHFLVPAHSPTHVPGVALLLRQVYPENAAQAEMLVGAAMRVGFSGGLVVDYPHSTRAKKYFLVLMVGPSSYVPAAKGLDGSEPMEGEEEEGGQVRVGQRQHKRGAGGKRKHGEGGGKGRGWVLHKKEQMRKKGYTAIPVDSKYTGRKRRKVT